MMVIVIMSLVAAFMIWLVSLVAVRITSFLKSLLIAHLLLELSIERLHLLRLLVLVSVLMVTLVHALISSHLVKSTTSASTSTSSSLLLMATFPRPCLCR